MQIRAPLFIPFRSCDAYVLHDRHHDWCDTEGHGLFYRSARDPRKAVLLVETVRPAAPIRPDSPPRCSTDLLSWGIPPSQVVSRYSTRAEPISCPAHHPPKRHPGLVHRSSSREDRFTGLPSWVPASLPRTAVPSPLPHRSDRIGIRLRAQAAACSTATREPTARSAT